MHWAGHFHELWTIQLQYSPFLCSDLHLDSKFPKSWKMLHSKSSPIQCSQFMPSHKVRATNLEPHGCSHGTCKIGFFCPNLNTSSRRAVEDPFQSGPMVKCSGRTSVLGSPSCREWYNWWVCSGESFLLPGSCFLSCSHRLRSWQVHARNVVCSALRRGAENKTEQKPEKEILYLQAGSRWRSQRVQVSGNHRNSSRPWSTAWDQLKQWMSQASR